MMADLNTSKELDEGEETSVKFQAGEIECVKLSIRISLKAGLSKHSTGNTGLKLPTVQCTNIEVCIKCRYCQRLGKSRRRFENVASQ